MDSDNTMPESFSVYPNPATDKVCISTSIKENQKLLCRIFSQSDQIIYESSLSATLLEIDIIDFPKGT